MERQILSFDTVEELVSEINNHKNDSAILSVYCHYDMACKVFEEFVRFGFNVHSVELHDESYDWYDSEYIVSLFTPDNLIFVEKAKSIKGKYICSECDIAYVHNTCNEELLNKINCDVINIYDISEELELECDCNECCHNCCEENDCSTEQEFYIRIDKNDENFGFYFKTDSFEEKAYVLGMILDKYL